MGEGLDESWRRSLETLSKKTKQRIQREMVWVSKMAVRWCVYDVVKSLCLACIYVRDNGESILARVKLE